MYKNKELFYAKISKSKFRNSFNLTDKDKKYVLEKGLSTIKEHAYAFIIQRITPLNPKNDGKQTPMRGHPVFIAQHACGCCCRNCLYKWHNIPKNVELNDKEIEYIVDIIMGWIIRKLEE